MHEVWNQVVEGLNSSSVSTFMATCVIVILRRHIWLLHTHNYITVSCIIILYYYRIYFYLTLLSNLLAWVKAKESKILLWKLDIVGGETQRQGPSRKKRHSKPWIQNLKANTFHPCYKIMMALTTWIEGWTLSVGVVHSKMNL